ncbi:MAG: hypothetical protein ILA26_09130 [Methanobrevibacter sp.]|uniref:Ig-like domain-containing protein n=1 Tax=Methanobrevibacter sp. TaxID=66852 RepID=UPI001B77F32E|nr:Ig-like domain-containing protein [Methanobrevibacter sp.]MBP3792173.1 hypothetical protein [Methanobrevibacter sp.]
MNMKINTICFILLFFFLISAASASDSSNETLEIENQPTQETDNLQMIADSDEVLSKSAEVRSSLTPASDSSQKALTKATQTKAQLKVTLKAPDVKMHYKDGSKFKVTLKDNNKKVMKNTNVKIAINGATYTKKTDSNGIALLSLNLKSGTYKVVTTYDGSSVYAKKSINSKVTIKSTIKCGDLTKYYKNTASYYSTFYDKKGKLLKKTAVKFNLNSKTYSVKTNAKGVGKLAIDLKPGKYSITSKNPTTTESITKTITIKSLLETKDLTMNDGSGSKFTVKVLNSYGKASPNKKVTVKSNGKTYNLKTDANGLASVVIDFEPGKYSVTTEYDGLKNTNQITVNKVIRHSPFSHVTSIPNYVNVTTPYVFHNSAYSLKTGLDGIIRMSKNEVYTIQISETKAYVFTQETIPGVDSTVIGYKTHLVPFDGSGIKSDYNRANLKGDGILISSGVNYTEIEYRSSTAENTEFFGMYMDKGMQNSETITYVQNNKIKAMVNFYTYSYDELGLKYNLAKYYGKSLYDFNYKSYDEMTNNNANTIRFSATGEPVTFNYFGKAIVGYLKSEDIKTRFIVNGAEELDKSETISYGLGEKYRNTFGFEVLQGYAILNEKVTKSILESWNAKGSAYLSRLGIMNLYGMFMASLETAWIADENANQHAKDFSVSWKRASTATILGGINLEDTYLHILNSDMGMKVSGSAENVKMFKMINSLNLPNIEEYVLKAASDRYSDETNSSLSNLLNSIATGNYSITQLGELLYVFDGNNSSIVLNTTSGLSNVIMSNGKDVYKGSAIHTKDDCCSVCQLASDFVNGVKNGLSLGISGINNLINKNRPLSMLLYYGAKSVLGKVLNGASSVAMGLFNTMAMVQTAGVTYRNGIVKENDWHRVMDTFTFTRPGYLQGKKVYNIPNKNGGYDYIEVKINDDLSLNRENVKYISNGKTKQLTKQETYQYFSDEYWTPFSMPSKYWDKSWKGS